MPLLARGRMEHPDAQTSSDMGGQGHAPGNLVSGRKAVRGTSRDLGRPRASGEERLLEFGEEERPDPAATPFRDDAEQVRVPSTEVGRPVFQGYPTHHPQGGADRHPIAAARGQRHDLADVGIRFVRPHNRRKAGYRFDHLPSKAGFVGPYVVRLRKVLPQLPGFGGCRRPVEPDEKIGPFHPSQLRSWG